MARTSVTTQQIARTGVNPALTAPVADGDVIDVGATFLVVANGGGAPVTVTVQTPVEYAGLELEDLTVSVPAAGQRWIGPFPASVFGQPVGDPNAGRALVDYSAVADVTRGVFKVS